MAHLIKVSGIAAVGFVYFELMRYVESYVAFTVTCVFDRYRTDEYRFFVVYKVLTFHSDRKRGMFRDDATHERILLTVNSYLPCKILGKPGHCSINPHAESVDIVPAHMVFEADIRVIEITHLTAVIERYQEVSVRKYDGTGHTRLVELRLFGPPGGGALFCFFSLSLFFFFS